MSLVMLSRILPRWQINTIQMDVNKAEADHNGEALKDTADAKVAYNPKWEHSDLESYPNK